MNIIAFNLEVAGKKICVLKIQFYFISPWKKNVIPKQMKKSQETCG